jgi:uncharacterized protein (DUF4415 family)
MTNFDIKKPKMTQEIHDMIKNAPEFDMNEIPELKDFKPGKTIARGFAQFKEYINRKGRPKSKETLQGIYIRLTRDTVEKLRSFGRGWQSRFREKVNEMAGSMF